VADVLRVAAVELRHPIALLVLMEAGDPPFHALPVHQPRRNDEAGHEAQTQGGTQKYEDTRLPALATDTTRFAFDLPAGVAEYDRIYRKLGSSRLPSGKPVG